MTVYVDDASIAATAGPHTSRWSHLFADTRSELHDFADALGLRREWFQDAPATWHYDLSEGKRARAIQLGAEAVTWREGADIIRERRARLAAVKHQSLREQITARLEAAGIGPDDPGLRQWARHNAGLGIGPATRSRLREAGREAEAG
jgi:hypothetical protein